ncbi:hypothetical protein Bpfe_004833 [Biomphalaria pfeifferi]|uniref:Uncharacterized protein n=1 Tax=Biomphalaria pfeifferi TaxID=112525 RepID=A0AAD8FJR3_BIOPF|nr:hypothetical protein Bpfe_004833 [Biomphalaria pfeifferi]
MDINSSRAPPPWPPPFQRQMKLKCRCGDGLNNTEAVMECCPHHQSVAIFFKSTWQGELTIYHFAQWRSRVLSDTWAVTDVVRHWYRIRPLYTSLLST